MSSLLSPKTSLGGGGDVDGAVWSSADKFIEAREQRRLRVSFLECVVERRGRGLRNGE